MNDLAPGISFENSYVLDLLIIPYKIELKMDFVLLPQHPAYQPPKPGEWACFKRGSLKISSFTKVTWNATGLAPATDANQEIDWGCLDEFTAHDQAWRMVGDWGSIEIEGGELTVELDTAEI